MFSQANFDYAKSRLADPDFKGTFHCIFWTINAKRSSILIRIRKKNNFGSRSRKQFRIQRIRIHNAALSPIIYLLGCTPLLKRVAEHVPGLKPHNWRTKIPPSANIQWLSQQLFISNISPYIRAESPIHSAPQYRDSPARIESPFHSAPQCRDSLARIESPFHSAPKYRDSPARIESLFNSAPQYRDSPARIKSLSFCAAFQG